MGRQEIDGSPSCQGQFDDQKRPDSHRAFSLSGLVYAFAGPSQVKSAGRGLEPRLPWIRTRQSTEAGTGSPWAVSHDPQHTVTLFSQIATVDGPPVWIMQRHAGQAPKIQPRARRVPTSAAAPT